jgi:hypothetical protein
MPHQPSVLLVGSSFSACPLFFSLKKRGLRVAVCGNLPDDPCHAYADGSFYIDYSSSKALADVLDANKFDYLVPSCNDAGYLSCAELAQARGFAGFDSFETTLILHEKAKFRNFATSAGLRVPGFVDATNGTASGLERLRFPVLVKPVDSFSGRGVSKVSAERELDAALSRAREESRSGAAVVEEFIEGSLHSHSAFIAGGHIVQDFFVDEFCTVYPYQVDCSNHPSLLEEEVRADVRAQMQKLITSLSLCDGLLHTQFIVSGGAPYIIECMRRAPGDIYNVLIERSTGYDYAGAYVEGFLGGAPKAHRPDAVVRNFARHTVSRSEGQVFASLEVTREVPACEFFPLKTSGHRLEPAPFDKLGIAFIEYPDRESMWSSAPRLAQQFTPAQYAPKMTA